ncbi:MAG: putative DNA binding domain-containing protein [Proteobacteria bacterium]|nr:putative DNA binding domain-containing protein [Pseudomonadota bacterium]
MNNFTQEDDKTEFKVALTDKLEKEVVAFLNTTKGGDIYIGVADNGQIVGVENADQLQLQISDRIKNNILPTCLGFYDVYPEQHDGKTIIHIVVSRGTEKPYYLKKYGMSPAGCYLRIGTGVQQMTTNMIDSHYSTRTRDSLRNIISPRTAKHSFAQLKIYYQENGFQLNDAFLENLDLYTKDGKLNYVAYLLADVNSVSIKVAKYAGTDKCDLIENEEYGYCSLIKATEKVLDKLEIENKTFTKITGAARRLQRNMIDKTALREALINAIVHNDYTREVPPVIEIYADRLTITSYGGLVQGLSQQEFFKGRSMPRNRELMRIFSDLELVEQLGSGMNRILKVYNNNIFNISEHFLETCFYYEKDYLKQLKNQSTMEVTTEVTTEVKKLILNCKGEQTRNQLQQILGLKESEHFRKAYIKPAIEQGLLEMTIPDKPNSSKQKYRLTEKGIDVQYNLSVSL